MCRQKCTGQVHGTAIIAFSYADLAMGEIDEKVVDSYKIDPQIDENSKMLFSQFRNMMKRLY